MGRPFSVIGFTMFASLIFIGVLGVKSAVVLFAICLILLPCFIFIGKLREKKAYLCALVVVLFCSVLYFCAYTYFYTPVEKYFDKKISISGQITDLPDAEYDRYYYQIKVDRVNGKEVSPKFKIRFSSAEELSANPYDTIQLKGNAYSLGSTNIYSKLNHLAKGEIIGINTTENVNIIKNNSALKPAKYYLLKYRQNLINNLYSVMPAKNAALCTAVLMGEKSYLSDSELNNINTVGISHLVCVSGLHLSIWGFAILTLFKKLYLPYKVRYALAGILIFLFMAFCGFTPSVVRAGIMFLIFIFAQIIYAEPDGLNSLGIAAAIILLNPFNALSIGFILSFLSTLAILTIGIKYCEKAKEKFTFYEKSRFHAFLFSLIEIFIISVCVNLFCLPVNILIFGKVTVLSLVANVLILPFASLLVITAGISAILGGTGVLSYILYPVYFVASGISYYIIEISDFLAKFSFATFNISDSFVVFFMAVMFALVALVLILSKKSNKRVLKATSAVLVLSFIVGYCCDYLLKYERCKITAYASDDKICLSIEQGDDLVLIDCGNYYNILYKIENLVNRSISSDIDYFIISGDNKYESAFAPNIMAHYDVKQVVMPVDSMYYPTFKSEYNSNITATDYAVIPVNDDLTLTFVSGQASAVLIEYKTQKVLFLSSSGIDVSTLPEEMLSYNYLIVRGKTSKTIVNSSLNGIIELSRCNMYAANARKLKQAGYIYFESGNTQDVQLIINETKSYIGRKNKWLQ